MKTQIVHGRNGVTLHVEPVDRCPGCKSQRIARFCETPDLLFGTGSYEVFECKECTLAFITPRPIEADLGITNPGGDDLPSGRGFLTSVRARRLGARTKDYLRHLGRSDARCIDIGCGDGFFAGVLADLPGVSYVLATDYGTERPPYLAREKPNVEYRSYREVFGTDEQFDVVFCRHMLEHVHDPAAWISKMHACLRPGGLLVLEVPRWDAIWLDVFRGGYIHIGAPTHLLQFTQRSLEHLLGAFTVAEWGQTHGLVLGLSLMGTFRQKRISPSSAFALACFPLEVAVERATGRWACLTCVARKN